MNLHDALDTLERYIKELRQLPDQEIQSRKMKVLYGRGSYQTFLLPTVDENVYTKVTFSDKQLDLEP